jgi:ergothioneine biosynthesis protein EgtB
MTTNMKLQPSTDLSTLERLYREVRAATLALAAPLSDADATVQSMPDASPAKWHLAHTTWFFETMVLVPNAAGYRVFDDHFKFLFNSYYETVGERQPRPLRGMITRPALTEVLEYRRHVDEAMARLFRSEPSSSILGVSELGCHHEQQHQELLLTDILHLFAQNPLHPAYKDSAPVAVDTTDKTRRTYKSFAGGMCNVGHEGANFAFDCEGPRHAVHMQPYRLGDRPVTNGEWMEFIADGGYRNPLLWLSDGWARACEEGWTAPLYWEARDGEFWTMTLRGFQPVNLHAPVCHLSYFEADAFATWAQRRLPTEAEWEAAAQPLPVVGNFVNSGRLRPKEAPAPNGDLRQMYGDVWEWTRSAFLPYPRFRPAAGAVGEYNGKFMSGQFVLRGGSCVTPEGHVRATYRNFFPPHARWQFSGLRLAEDA